MIVEMTIGGWNEKPQTWFRDKNLSHFMHVGILWPNRVPFGLSELKRTDNV